MTLKPKPKILVVLGPTSSGKSDVAVELAKKHGGEVISADSRQVYRSLDIGSGKITKREMRGIPHHMLDVANPKLQFSVAEFKKQADKIIADIISRDKLPILCGGTGFYIQAVVDDVSLPEVAPDEKLRKKLQNKTAEELFCMLKKLDPRRAKEIDRQNPRRLIRAIEIAKALGKVPNLDIHLDIECPSDLGMRPLSHYSVLQIGLDMSDVKLRQRIHLRFLRRMKQGMVAEVRNLHSKGLSWKRMHSLGLEYRCLAEYVKSGEKDKEKLQTCIETGNWHYAKKQRMWFKRDKRILWFEPREKKKIEQEVGRFLK